MSAFTAEQTTQTCQNNFTMNLIPSKLISPPLRRECANDMAKQWLAKTVAKKEKKTHTHTHTHTQTHAISSLHVEPDLQWLYSSQNRTLTHKRTNKHTHT